MASRRTRRWCYTLFFSWRDSPRRFYANSFVFVLPGSNFRFSCGDAGFHTFHLTLAGFTGSELPIAWFAGAWFAGAWFAGGGFTGGSSTRDKFASTRRRRCQASTCSRGSIGSCIGANILE